MPDDVRPREALAKLRKDKGWSQEEFAQRAGLSPITVSRAELGKQRPEGARKRRYASTLGISLERMNDILDGKDSGEEHSYAGLSPKRFSLYISLEQTAVNLDTYENHVVEGLLQTEDYARSLIEAEHGTGTRAERLVELRMSRQTALTRKEAPLTYRVLLYEAALRLEVGDNDVMRTQLEHLLGMSELVNVSVRVLPFSAGPHTADRGAFSLLTLPFDEGPSIAYLETYTNGPMYIEDGDSIALLSKRFERLLPLCLPENESRKFIERSLRTYS